MPESNRKKILIVDDDAEFYHGFKKKYGRKYLFDNYHEPENGLHYAKINDYDLLLLDLDFRSMGYNHGLDIILPRFVREIQGKYPIIICTNDTQATTFQRAIKQGARHLFRKNQYNPGDWELKIQEVLQGKGAAGIRSKPEGNEEIDFKFIAAAPEMVELKKRLELLPQFGSMAPVLFLGETGVGKEVAAKFFWHAKGNKKLPFVALNLSAISEKLLESELFGHVKGAFTDAYTDKEGLFEKAKNGILFLDEIGDVSLEIQVKLLRVLQDKRFKKVGSNDSFKLEAQLVFATNKDLQKAIQQGTFRRDFFERISAFSFEIPPLRRRLIDLVPLIDYFLGLEEVCPPGLHFYGKKAEDCFTVGALLKLSQYTWPGNIRELQNSLQKILFEAFIAGKNKIDEQILPNRFNQKPLESVKIQEDKINQNSATTKTTPQHQNLNWSIDKQTAYNELERVEKALIDSGGRKNDAALLLGLKSDQTLRYKVCKKHYVEYPELFEFFPTIRKVYKLN